MTDLTKKQERFLQDDIPTRLGHLAANLARIKSFSDEQTHPDFAVNLIRESQYFIEWTAPQMDIDTAAELVDLGRTLSRWKLNWEKIWSDAAALSQVKGEVASWSQRVLDMSGLLSESVSEAC
ncbi:MULTISPECIES: hypothetical protein [Fischerella]|uniref:Uncharacterized protein n=1 Tax=Fischerella muscicola CCMEE 5323 TaxID=2019572 RepID=A0A2N6K475_FISMU|nr:MULTISPECIES: hypothetical protein [Fischerella]MBD2435165.1 hypothetical protein [Fischerella sp. FACHB-380]PLZ90733.1 hypothetical protein CEN44_10175 [Fischerella muscicola CCMEE 5323]